MSKKTLPRMITSNKPAPKPTREQTLRAQAQVLAFREDISRFQSLVDEECARLLRDAGTVDVHGEDAASSPMYLAREFEASKMLAFSRILAAMGSGLTNRDRVMKEAVIVNKLRAS